MRKSEIDPQVRVFLLAKKFIFFLYTPNYISSVAEMEGSVRRRRVYSLQARSAGWLFVVKYRWRDDYFPTLATCPARTPDSRGNHRRRDNPALLDPERRTRTGEPRGG